jgi:hypothetical protein
VTPVANERVTGAISDYRPVSPLAVAALVLGICSAMALVTRFAWVVPLVAAAVAIAALADLARPGTAKAGRLLALAGLALAVGFGAQAVTSAAVDRWIESHRAGAAARAWIDAVRDGRPAEALGLCGAAVASTASMPPDPTETDVEVRRLERFIQLDAVRAVAACHATQPEVTSCQPLGTDDNAWTVRAALASCGGGEETLRLVVSPKTTAAGTTGVVERWKVMAIDLER